MKKRFHRVLGAFVTTLLFTPLLLPAQGTAFTYQGRLNDGAGPAGGSYDFRFRLASDPLANNYVGGNFLTNALPISNGLFTVTLDFGAVFTGSNYWLEVAVRTNGAGGYTTLNPLQPLTPTPYAIFAAGASNVLGVVPNGGLSGSYGGAVSFNNPADVFSGNGGGLTNVNAAMLGGVAASNYWKTLGNAGTSSTNGSFLGTTDNQPLELKVNGQRAVRLEPALDTPNIINGNSNNTMAQGLQGSVIAGGGLSPYPNTMLASYGTIGGGTLHTVAGAWGTVAGGRDSSLYADSSTIAGGYGNLIYSNGYAGFIGGGQNNSLNSYYAAVAGGQTNVITTNSEWSFIGGGFGNVISNSPLGSQLNFIGGGAYNNIWGDIAGIGSGYGNILGPNLYESFIGGGLGNVINGSQAFLGGGLSNSVQASAQLSAIGGGQNNVVANGADHSFIGGGLNNTNGGQYSSIPGGYQNFSGGRYSLAAGRQAKATNDGVFIWADSTGGDYSSTTSNQFLVRAGGGVSFANGQPGVNVDALNLSDGTINYGLKFGYGSGEGVASKRTAGGNQYGLDLYTEFAPRISISQTGTVSIPGLLRSGVETGTSEAPNPVGLIVRRINSSNKTFGQVVARTDTIFLERDGSNSGLIVSNSAPVIMTINSIGVNNVNSIVAKHFSANEPGPGFITLIFEADHVTHVEISFGVTAVAGQHLTQVVLDRYDDGVTDDFHWAGTLTSTFNQ